MRSLALLVVVRVHTWSDVCPVCGSMRNTGSLYVLHAPRLPKSSLLAALVVYTHTICVRVMYMCVFIYVCVYIYLRMCVHVHVTYTSKRTESNFSWERHFMSSCCLFGRQRSVRRRWKIMESRCLWVTGTLISGRLKWLRATWTYVSRVQMNGE